jgi:nitrite reductase/ring-hydroxylating ferredoxin subunit
MAKKKQNSAPHKAQTPAKKGVGMGTWIAAAFAVIAVIAVIIIAGTGSGGGAATAGASTGAAGGAPAVSADEAKYVGRLLPASYTEPSVGGATTYSSSVAMTNVTPSQGAKQTTIKVADLVADKIVYFEYKTAGGAAIPMLAYVKPSGKLFVGVSFCPPCKGKQQTIEADGTLRCASCGTKRDLETGAGVSGACRRYPIDEVPATLTGGNIVIQNSVLDGWTAQPLDRPVGA